MSISIRAAKQKDITAIKKLLSDAALPHIDCQHHINHFIVATIQHRIIAAGGFEAYQLCALLRSVVVAENHQNQGIGKRIYQQLLSNIKTLNINELFLLTESATCFFQTLGFKPYSRAKAPLAIQHTAQFSSLCPQSATLMRLHLTTLTD